MSRKRHTSVQIIGKLREAEVGLARAAASTMPATMRRRPGRGCGNVISIIEVTRLDH